MPTEPEIKNRRGRPVGKKTSLSVSISQSVMNKILDVNEAAGGFESVSVTTERLLRAALDALK